MGDVGEKTEKLAFGITASQHKPELRKTYRFWRRAGLAKAVFGEGNVTV